MLMGMDLSQSRVYHSAVWFLGKGDFIWIGRPASGTDPSLWMISQGWGVCLVAKLVLPGFRMRQNVWFWLKRR